MAQRDYAYASAVDVLGHLTLAATFTATSRPNATQVHAQLLDTANELDSALRSADYSVPVATGATQAFDKLNTYNAIGAAMYVTAAHPAGQDSRHLAFLERRWQAILTGIAAGEIAIDAPKDPDTAKPRFGAPGASGFGASPYFGRNFPAGI